MTPPDPTTSGVRTVKSAARSVDVLEYLALHGDHPIRLRELSEELGVPRSSLHALLRTLVDKGWVRTDSTGTLHAIGIRALLVGTKYLDADPHVPLVTPFLDQLREQLDETFHLGRMDGTDIVYLATRESSQYLRPFSRVGRRLPAHATSLGKAVLATLPEHEVSARLPQELNSLTPKTIIDRNALLADLALARGRGYAIDNEENTLGVRCFAVALQYNNPVTDAISASVPIARLDSERQAVIVSALRATSEKILRVVSPMGVPW